MKRLLEQELIEWKNKKEHLPLLLRGARQVGKSYLVESFGKTHFDDVVILDFERRPELKKCFLTREPTEILEQVEVLSQKKVTPGKTLLFFDEIQECPDALVSLRYFKELMPEQHVIAAGSLMEFLLNDEKYSFPVGRVEFLYLRPLSFKEFLMAVAPLLEKHIESQTQSQVIHEELLKWVRKYLFIGGMPAAVNAYLETSSLLESQKVHSRILQAYQSDFGKYAKHTQHKYLEMVFNKAPALISQTLKYTSIDPDARSRDLKPAIELLTKAGLFQQMFATTAAGLPLHAHIRDHRFKLLFLDVGLLQTASQVHSQDFLDKEILQINAGAIAEQFVGQELLASDDVYQNRPLLFWEGEGQSEIDFLITIQSQMTPIEVKAGSTGSLRSLKNFMHLKNLSLGVRISEHPFSHYDSLMSIPFYLVHTLRKLALLFLKA